MKVTSHLVLQLLHLLRTKEFSSEFSRELSKYLERERERDGKI